MLVHYLGSNRRRRPLREVELPALTLSSTNKQKRGHHNFSTAKRLMPAWVQQHVDDATASKQVDST